MTAQVLHSPSHFPSSPSSISCVNNDSSHQTQSLINSNSSSTVDEREILEEEDSVKEEEKEEDQLSLLALLLTLFRKSIVVCKTTGREELCSMEIGWPTNVQHVAHVTFDRFNGFLGLPVEFEPEVPRRAPSASANVFGVSTDSMQCSYDSRGNSVPTILLLMQRRLYSQGGLQAEGIFRINAENSQEEYVRDQLNRGIVPEGIDVHCLAGLIKAWFRELPTGVLDSLSSEQVMQCQSEDECAQLVSLLPSTEGALLDWAVNLMADVVQEEHRNKMNARNVAMVFAPNMTQMADPLTALMYAVQVMNFLKTLIIKTLREREDSVIDDAAACHPDNCDENGHEGSSLPSIEPPRNEELELVFVANEPILDNEPCTMEESGTTGDHDGNFQNSSDKAIHDSSPLETPSRSEFLLKRRGATSASNVPNDWLQTRTSRNRSGQSSNSNIWKEPSKVNGQNVVCLANPTEKSMGTSIISRINSRVERVEAWR
ncbi:rho GTPase-activating protein 5-like [Aristolochia californica]|uniref:rho GTPase-activating protein 5-like n=1 Tax=Aristolochia californica TaxID=171875 RepID=UPI0035D7405A